MGNTCYIPSHRMIHPFFPSNLSVWIRNYFVLNCMQGCQFRFLYAWHYLLINRKWETILTLLYVVTYIFFFIFSHSLHRLIFISNIQTFSYDHSAKKPKYVLSKRVENSTRKINLNKWNKIKLKKIHTNLQSFSKTIINILYLVNFYLSIYTFLSLPNYLSFIYTSICLSIYADKSIRILILNRNDDTNMKYSKESVNQQYLQV